MANLMKLKRLSILGMGLYLPPAHSVRDIALAHGADVNGYKGWAMACHALEGDHPSTMGAAALRQALIQSGVSPNDLSLVIFTGGSRDYVPSWSVATEIMRLCEVPGSCFGLDLSAGCVATLSGLDLAQSWLAARGGYAAVIAGERWSHTVDFSDVGLSGLWSYGDSGGAFVVGMDVPQPSIIDFLGAGFHSVSENNGQVLIRYGGTREPQAPPGVNPHLRALGARIKKEVTASYRKGYSAAYAALQQRSDIKPERLVSNQSSPQIVGMLSELFGMQGRSVSTGDRTGHLGGTDMLVGLQALREAGQLNTPVLVGSSTSYGFGTGLLAPPA